MMRKILRTSWKWAIAGASFGFIAALWEMNTDRHAPPEMIVIMPLGLAILFGVGGIVLLLLAWLFAGPPPLK
jgi:hypothetical protein